MRHLLIFSIIVCISCSSSNKELLNGKWATINDQGEYFELWIKDSLSLGYQAETGELFFYRINTSDDILNFTLKESHISSKTQYSVEISELTETTMITEFIGLTSSNSRTRYERLDQLVPEIFNSLELNEVYYPEFVNRALKHYEKQ